MKVKNTYIVFVREPITGPVEDFGILGHKYSSTSLFEMENGAWYLSGSHAVSEKYARDLIADTIKIKNS